MKEYGIINAYCLDLDGSPAKLTSARNSKCHGLERVEWRPGAWRLFPLPLKAHVKSVVPFIHLRYLVYWWLCYHLQRWRKKGYYRISLALDRSEEHTSELQSLRHLVCRLLLEKKKKRT